jgi:hypothetical protein
VRNIHLRRKWWALLAVSLLAGPILFVAWSVAWEVVQVLLTSQPLPTRQTWLGTIGGVVLLVALAAGLYWIPLQSLLTQFSVEGVSQPHLFGQKFIRWTEVTRLGGRGFNASISSERETITLTLYVFSEPDQVITEVKRRVPPSAAMPT